MSLESVSSTIEEEEIEFVRFEFSDFYGISRCKIIPARHFVDKASNGIGIPFCHLSSSIDGAELHLDTPYGNGEVGIGDGIWFPEFNTFRILPWYRKTASILLEPKYYKGEPVSCYPRYIARQQIERLEKLGISLLAAHEHEFYVVDQKTQKPFTQDMCFRSTIRTYTDPNLLDQLMTNLYKVGIDVENCESESGHGQMEITYKPRFGIQAADNAYFFKTTVKEIAQQHGYIASFMSKPFADQMGTSAHFCHSLWDKDCKKNLLYDANDHNKLSEIGRYWMAGILKHSPAITMLMAPTVNCYKRYGKQSYVSTTPNWGIDNRCCMLRLKINGTKGTYLENRSSGGGSNPYLTLAAVVAAGIDGIEKKLPLPEEETGDPFRMTNNDPAKNGLPCTLSNAI
ncbi:lengsin-like [Amphiura filiformis]|uniref:lengsin-like n=1 Tax=Amphiura filiformis TaxID=82378 RepID=UPI003B210018